MSPSLPIRIGPIRVSPVATSTTAPAPSANTAEVPRSAGSTTRVMKSAPITTTQDGAAGVDHRGAGRQRGDEARAGGADVKSAGAGGAERLGDQRCGVGHDLVGRAGRDQHQVHVGGVDAGLLQRDRCRRCRMGLEALVGRGHVACPDSGTPLDPVRREPQPRLDL